MNAFPPQAALVHWALPLVYSCLVEELLSDQINSSGFSVLKSIFLTALTLVRKTPIPSIWGSFPWDEGVAEVLYPWHSPRSDISRLVLLHRPPSLTLCPVLISLRWEAHVAKPRVPASLRLCQANERKVKEGCQDECFRACPDPYWKMTLCDSLQETVAD